MLFYFTSFSWYLSVFPLLFSIGESWYFFMAPIRGGNKKKRKIDEKDEETTLLSGSSKETSADWFLMVSKKIAGHSLAERLSTFEYIFGMSRKTFKYICSLVEKHMTGNFTFSSGMLMAVDDQVAVALRRLGSGQSLISIGESLGAHHSTISQVTWRFVEAIEETGLHHIRWPSNEQEMAPIKSKFEKIHGLPNCCGVIDMSHITMTLPSSQQRADVWRDHMNNHSMLLQAVVDPNFRFIDIFAGMPGKMNEMEVLQNSNFYALCEKGKRLNGTTLNISEDTDLGEYIIGKEAYPLLPWLIRPYHEITPTAPEQEAKFNDKISKARVIANIALRNLKERWKLIQGPMWRPDKNKLPRAILVCCILHNILIDTEGDTFMNSMNFSGEHDPGYDLTVCDSIDHSASVLRNKLSKYLHGELHY